MLDLVGIFAGCHYPPLKKKNLLLLKSSSKNQALVFTISLSVFLLNIFQGSKLYFDSDPCFPINLESGILALTVVIVVLLFAIKKTKLLKRIILPLLFASVIAVLIEPFVSSYQLNRTNKNLETTCNSIAEFKINYGRLPNNLADLNNGVNHNTGFKIYNNVFQYKKEDDENFKILYDVKYGYTCEVWNCSTYFANSIYTCVLCGEVHNVRLTKTLQNH